MTEIPVIDISTARNGTAQEIDNVAKQINLACMDVGFLLISGHGISEQLIQSVFDVSKEFFDLTTDQKLLVSRPSPAVLRGFIPFRSETLSNSLGGNEYDESIGDLNESFMIGPPSVPKHNPYYFSSDANNLFADNIWPDYPENFRHTLEEYYREMTSLSTLIMSLFARALDLPAHYFSSKIDKAVSRLRIRNYPALENAEGHYRAGAHRDYGSLTILKTDAQVGGLEVDNNGQWAKVPVIPNTFVVNIGELMELWTNNKWKATLHRVSAPPELVNQRRMSIVFFHNPNYDAEISCIPTCITPGGNQIHPTTTSGEYLRSQFLKTQTSR